MNNQRTVVKFPDGNMMVVSDAMVVTKDGTCTLSIPSLSSHVEGLTAHQAVELQKIINLVAITAINNALNCVKNMVKIEVQP